MTDGNDDSLNLSIINTSEINSEDFGLFVDCLEETCQRNTLARKKTAKSRDRQRSKKSARTSLNQTTAFERDDYYAPLRSSSSCYSVNDGLDDSVATVVDHSVNEVDVSYINEMFSSLFPYLSEDVSTQLLEDSDHEAPREKTNAAGKKTEVQQLQAKGEAYVQRANGGKDDRKFKKPYTPPKLRVQPRRAPAERMNQTTNEAREKMYSSMSTLSLHESESDSNSKQSSDDLSDHLSAMKVRDRVSFFNETIKSMREPRTPPVSTPSTSSDDERALQRQRSKRTFQQNRDYFEKIFRERMVREKAARQQSAVEAEANKKLAAPKAEKALAANGEMTNGRVAGAQIYAQTKNLLERIQYLVAVVKSLDEHRSEKINLKRLKKHLLFFRDCSHKFQSVCLDFDERFLSELERNVVAAEELLYSALKPYMQKVADSPLDSHCGTLDLFYI